MSKLTEDPSFPWPDGIRCRSPPTDRPSRPSLRRNYTATVIFPGRPSEEAFATWDGGTKRDLSRPWGFLSSYKLAQQVVSRTRHRTREDKQL